eukprot:gene4679-20963_t
MVLKKIDNRIRVLIENGVSEKHRTLFFIVGDHARDQVVILHHMLSKAQVKARPSVLWCYKKELGFSSHRKKRMKQLQKKVKSGTLDMKKDDPFELFIAATSIRYCYYHETHKILGSTYGMLVLQDFEAISPNLLARTVETIEGGGVVCILLKTMKSLKQLYTMTMDVHSRYRTEAHKEVVGRFNERFLLSLASCKKCLVIDDQLRILPLSTDSRNITALPPKTKEESYTPEEIELKELKESLQDTQPVGNLVNHCKTVDQAKCLLKFIEAISEKTLRTTVALTAPRGRGKSASMGLAMASAIAFGYSNIFVTSPSPENLKTLFEFVFKGFDALEYQEHLDYELIQSTNPDFNKAVVRVNVFREHRQTIQYIHPSDAHKLGQAELVVIDEAAAIPLPLVKKLLGPYLVFMASTVNGYEGTGRSLSLKLIQQLREKSAASSRAASKNGDASKTTDTATPGGRLLLELSLNESIRYANGDHVEKWLNELLCLDASVVPRIHSGCPVPESCDLYPFNTPDDLQLMSDAPAHHLFCLLGPVDSNQKTLPEVLCFIQVSLEGEISKATVMNSLARGKRASGDLIPWTISQQFNDSDFASLSGARVVRIATHPEFQGMGYGKRALQQLVAYYEGKIPNITEDGDDSDAELNRNTEIETGDADILEEHIEPRKDLPPLLSKLSERKAEKLDYVGVSFGLTAELLRFWRKSFFIPVYVRQTANDLTGEHTCIMLRTLNEEEIIDSDALWLKSYWQDFRRRFIALLSYQFREFTASLGLGVLQNKFTKESDFSDVPKGELDLIFTKYDLRRLDLYSRNLVDYHLIMDLLPEVSRLYFSNRMDFKLSTVQSAILLGIGLQHKRVDELEKELDLPGSQILGLFNRMMKKVTQYLNGIVEKEVEQSLAPRKSIIMEPTAKSLDKELDEAEKEFKEKQKQEMEKLKSIDFTEFAISGNEQEWNKALGKTKKLGNISIGRIMKRRLSSASLRPPGSMPENEKKGPKNAKKARKSDSRR